MVSMAGIFANLTLVVLATLLLFVFYGIALGARLKGNLMLGYIDQMLWAFITTNLTLAFFNLLPVPPLDGYHLFNDLILKRPLYAQQNTQRITSMVLFGILFFTDWVSRYINFIHTHVIGSIYRLMEFVFTAMHLG